MTMPRSRRLALLTALASLGLALSPAAAADAPQATLYTGATVIDGTGGAAHADQDILVEGERIVASARMMRWRRGPGRPGGSTCPGASSFRD